MLQEQFILPFLIREPVTATTPPVTAPGRKLLILLHGVGSNEQDLFRFAGHFPDFFVLSPRGPYTLGTARYAWYQVDFSTGKPIINAEQEEKSRQILLQFIGQLKQAYTADEIWLGGFSQGAIMSYTIGLTQPGEVKGILALSGRIPGEIKPLIKRKAAALEALRVFISHGSFDNTLPVGYAREAREYLQQLGVPVSYHEYTIGHQIDNSVLDAMAYWLAEQTP